MKSGIRLSLILIYLFTTGCSETPPEDSTAQTPVSQSVIISNNESLSEVITPTPKPLSGITSTRPFHLLGTIEVLNRSLFPSEEIENWVSSSKSMMKDQDSNVLIVIYPIGEFRNPNDSSDWEGAIHEVIMSPEEIIDLLATIHKWFTRDACMARNIDLQNSELSTYREYLESGAAVQTQVMLCQRTRLVIMGLPVSTSLEDHEISFREELYHAFQHDIGDSRCAQRAKKTEENNSDWMVEGGAHFFATFLALQEGPPSNFEDTLLESGLMAAKLEGTDINRGSIDIKGAVGLLLLVNQGWLDQNMILDGTLFQNCLRETDYGFQTPEIRHIKKAWHLIQKNDGRFMFLEAAVGPDNP